MSLTDQLSHALNSNAGYSSATPTTVTLTDPAGIEVGIDLTAVDSMSSSVREIRINVPSLVGAGFDTLKQWAENLSNRVTYLLENIGPLELDSAAGQVLIRSNPPNRQSGTTEFYEVLLQSHADGHFSLRRYSARQGTPGKTQVDLSVTHEVLEKLICDLVETIP